MVDYKKSQPVRMCCVCHKHSNKHSLTRFVAENGCVVVDKVYKKPGRGAYICKNIECLKKAKKFKSLTRALKTNVLDSFYDELCYNLKKEIGDG